MGAVVRQPCRGLAGDGPKGVCLPLALQKQQVPTCPRSEKKGQEETAHTVSKLTHILKDQCCITQVFHGNKHCLVPVQFTANLYKGIVRVSHMRSFYDYLLEIDIYT